MSVMVLNWLVNITA